MLARWTRHVCGSTVRWSVTAAIDHRLSLCTCIPAHCLLAPSGYALLAKPASGADAAPAAVAAKMHPRLLAVSAITDSSALLLEVHIAF